MARLSRWTCRLFQRPLKCDVIDSNSNKVCSLSACRFSTILIVGGGGPNLLLNQMTAEATDRTVRVGPSEATATSNTLTQAIVAGDLDGLDELRRVASNSFDLQVYPPIPRQMVRRLRPVFGTCRQ